MSFSLTSHLNLHHKSSNVQKKIIQSSLQNFFLVRIAIGLRTLWWSVSNSNSPFFICWPSQYCVAWCNWASAAFYSSSFDSLSFDCNPPRRWLQPIQPTYLPLDVEGDAKEQRAVEAHLQGVIPVLGVQHGLWRDRHTVSMKMTPNIPPKGLQFPCETLDFAIVQLAHRRTKHFFSPHVSSPGILFCGGCKGGSRF